jgi:rhodanese-related sulfurtransferase
MLSATFQMRLLITGLLLFIWNHQTHADGGGYKEITAPEVKELIESGKGVLVNVLSQIEHEMQHIPGSINIPITDIQTSPGLPKDKSTPLVFYCMGTR